ncbi:putative ternary complex factor MIP1, leucine-zipper [Arabidopsis thaliana]
MSGDSLLTSKQGGGSLSIYSQPKNVTKEFNGRDSPKNSKFHHYRFELEHDVKRLKNQLQKETAMRALLLKASDQSHKIELSHASSLPRSVQELLTNIAAMEATVSKLEQEIMSLHFLLIQERNERKLAEYNLTHSLSPPTFRKNESLRPKDHKAQPRSKVAKSLQSFDNANELSKEMIRCMRNIFVSLGETSAGSKSSQETASVSSRENPPSSSTSWWSPSEHSRISRWAQSPRIDIQKNSDVLATESDVFDLYTVQGKLSWADIGSYRSATEVASMSVEEKRLGYASDELWRFRNLVERLARVNPAELSHNEKLAFWINIYNAMIMHAYLAYGVPKTDLKLFSLMQKAAYTVGGHSYNAATIEYMTLKMSPPLHRPQIALLLSILKLKVSDEQRQAGISTPEPLVSFALSCGMHSSPAVRIYSAENVGEELEEAQKDYIQASVGVSPRGKLIVPQMLHCFAKKSVDDCKVALWISRHLPPRQAAFVEQCIHRRQRWGFLGSSSSKCGIVPFDSRFRYLFLP